MHWIEACEQVGDIVEAGKRLKNKPTAGADYIPSFVVKDCLSIFVESLHFLFNLILEKSTFPKIWKICRVCPVFKSGDNTDVCNYRKITILCNFEKLFESITHGYVCRKLRPHLSKNQHGFMKHRSTLTNLATLATLGHHIYRLQ